MMKRNFDVSGMSCASCVSHVERAVSAVKGVTDVSASLLTSSMTVEGGRDSDIVAAVKKAGYGASLSEGTPYAVKNESDGILLRLILSAALLIPIIYIATFHGMYYAPLPDFMTPKLCGIAQMILSFAVIAVNAKLFASGVRSLIKLSPNMNALIALGSGAAFIYSAAVLFTGGDMLYFESAAMIPTFINIGKYLESLAKKGTTEAIENLVRLMPQLANVTDEDGNEKTVSASEVRVGETVIVRPGESVPVDGTVTEGHAEIDESAVTGEPLPVPKTAGSPVTAGTVCADGVIRIRAEKTGNDTEISDIVKLVAETSSGKARIGRIADRAAAFFVPTVMILALITAIVWAAVSKDAGKALSYGISVLVVSCPCALGLATPVAITVGCGKGAQNRILFRSAEALECAGRTKTAVFDKTGTLTEGRPTVVSSENLSGEYLSVLFSLEKNSIHPIAKGIADYAAREGAEDIEASDVTVISGGGIRGRIGETEYSVCSRAYAEESGADLSEFGKFFGECDAKGETPVVLMSDRVLCALSVADTERKSSKEGIALLKESGVDCLMLTGDTQSSAEKIALGVGIPKENVISRVRPGEKAAVIKKLTGEGFTAMIGDGINDAPALSAADIGVAMSGGTDTAGNASDIILLRNSVRDFAGAVNLSRVTVKTIKQNLLWAFCYNLIGIPLAAGVFSAFGLSLSPGFCSMAMSVSSFIVVTNSLRIKRLDIYMPVKIKAKEEKKKMEVTLKIEGMMCCHCEARVKEALEKNSSVGKAEVSHESGTAVITLKKNIDVKKLEKIVTDAGYRVIG